MNPADRDFFAQNGYLDLGQVFDDDEVAYFLGLYEADRADFGYVWRPWGHHQVANYDALITTTRFDELIRHPKILPLVQDLMGGPLCFSEIGLRHMEPYEGEFHQEWHRDRPHWDEHPLRLDYLQFIVYLKDVDEGTHCLSLSPESVDEPVLRDHEAQFARNGVVDLHGVAGTCALFNSSVLHTATTRPTQTERKSIQIYYGHRDRKYISNDGTTPAALWRDHPDAETRAFYGVLNERTRIYAAAFAKPGEKL